MDEKKREVCCIRFDAATRAQLSGPDAASEGSFGLRYNFTLRDRVEENAEGGGGQAVDLPSTSCRTICWPSFCANTASSCC